jgi:hypothetical protein
MVMVVMKVVAVPMGLPIFVMFDKSKGGFGGRCRLRRSSGQRQGNQDQEDNCKCLFHIVANAAVG